MADATPPVEVEVEGEDDVLWRRPVDYDPSGHIRVGFSISGAVIGVFFRRHCLINAIHDVRADPMVFKLYGWCANTTGGRVQGEVQGPRELVREYLALMRQGPAPRPDHPRQPRVDRVVAWELPLADAEDEYAWVFSWLGDVEDAEPLGG